MDRQTSLFDEPIRDTFWDRHDRVPLPSVDPNIYLQAAQAWLMDSVEEKGADCPCCGKFVKAYSRTMNKTMAASLVWIAKNSYRTGRNAWLDIPNNGPAWMTRSNQHTTLAWWGLIERKPSDSGDKKHSGLWRITSRGLRVASGQEDFPKKVLTYNGEVYGFSEDRVMISDCTEEIFSYERAMRPVSES